MIRYLNTTLYGVKETIDQLDSDDYPNIREFKEEKNRLLNEYALAGGFGALYWSQRKCKG